MAPKDGVTQDAKSGMKDKTIARAAKRAASIRALLFDDVDIKTPLKSERSFVSCVQMMYLTVNVTIPTLVLTRSG